MNEVYFRDFAQHILAAIAGARYSIQVAVCWFSHQGIFEALLHRLRAGVRVQLILEYDNRNVHPEGLPFHRYLGLGGSLFAHRDSNLMHHKFAIIDRNVLLTGSFNWTHSNNAENLIRTTNPVLVDSFQEAFYRLLAVSIPVYSIRPKELKYYSDAGLFADQSLNPDQIRLQLSLGATIWRLAPDYEGLHWPGGQPVARIYFDPEKTLQHYWSAYVWHDPKALRSYFRLQDEKLIPPDIRLWMSRLRKGDLLVVSKSGWDYLAQIETDPLPSDYPSFGGRFGLRWLRVIEAENTAGPSNRIRRFALKKIRESRFALFNRFYGTDTG